MEITINLMSVLAFILWYLAVGVVGMFVINMVYVHTEGDKRSKAQRKDMRVRGVVNSFLFCWAFPYAVVVTFLDWRSGAISHKLHHSVFVDKDTGERIGYNELCAKFAKHLDVWLEDDASPSFWAIGKHKRMYKWAKKVYTFEPTQPTSPKDTVSTSYSQEA